MFFEYFYIFRYFVFCFLLCSLLFMASYFLVYQKPYVEKVSTYECGFNPWGDARSKFEVRFYLVGILFIVFDLEIMFLFPWVVGLTSVFFEGFFTMLLFIFILTVDLLMNDLRGLWIEINASNSCS